MACQYSIQSYLFQFGNMTSLLMSQQVIGEWSERQQADVMHTKYCSLRKCYVQMRQATYFSKIVK